MTQKNRVSSGRSIDQSKPIGFTFNGQQLAAYEGDTIASALLANGIKIVGRSFKYGRPRGIMSAGVEDPNAILQVGCSPATQRPNVRATQQEVYDGLVCRTTNGWPSVNWDVMAVFGGLAGKLMPPGFYYKTLMFPRFLWHTWEKVIRQGAGIGVAPTEPDPDVYDKMTHHCDLLIVGAGPAGLAAALAAVETGARIILLDENAAAGGTLRYSNGRVDDMPCTDWVKNTLEILHAAENVQTLQRTTAIGYLDGNFVVAHERRTDHIKNFGIVSNGAFGKDEARQRLHRIRARRVVLATGAHERPLVYANNDLPGCMQATAVSAYLIQYGVRPGTRLVVMTTNNSGYEAAFNWINATGPSIATVVDTRQSPNIKLMAQARGMGIEVITGSVVTEVVGRREVKAAIISGFEGDQLAGESRYIEADVVASSGGWSPVVHLSCHTGTRPDWRNDIAAFVPGDNGSKLVPAGAVTGEYSLSDALTQGWHAANGTLGEIGFAASDTNAPVGEEAFPIEMVSLFHVPHRKPTSRAPFQFVDYQLDVTAAAVELATREGFESVEHIKRYTALGFGTDQGKLSNVNGVAIAAKALGQSISETGTTMFRPNYTPVSFGAIAGRDAAELFEPKRYTAMQPWHEANGALFEDVGQWKRPWYFPNSGETLGQAVNRECLAVRQSVGVLDASTLGKIDIQGPDARKFLSRIYTNAWKKLAVGKCRYGLMCGEDGMVMDDGVTACLGDQHFVMTTTTGGAAHVMEWLELWHQTEWPELQVYFNSVTDHWATVTISGPNARKLLADITDLDLSNEAFPFMEWREAIVAGIPARVFRISFTGELSFEINVNANYGMAIWEAVIVAGRQYDITPYGTETMHVLRAEKGFIIVGQDTDGSLTPEDLGMSWALAMGKPFSFVGKRGMMRADCQREGRKQLVGLKPVEPDLVLPEGSQILLDKPDSLPAEMIGHVTSSYYSAALGHSFALALVEGGQSMMGSSLTISVGPDVWAEAEVCDTVFYDPAGERQHVE
ncbi:MAG: sarcosine oxidase subunit alpha [Planctomycetaceae bacterium]